jgi:serine protease AprX
MAFVLVLSALFTAAPVQRAARTAIDATLAQYLSTHPGQRVEVVVQTKADPSGLATEVRRGGGAVDYVYPGLPGFAAGVSGDEADRLNHDPRVRRINLDAPVRWLGSAVNPSNLATRYETLSRVPQAWAGGLDGSGVEVAVVDSGGWPHDDLTLRSPYVPGNIGNRFLGVNTNPRSADFLDHVGHGTHVAGIIAGNGYDSGGQYIGVAPNALIVGVKVADATGAANEGDVISGLEWVLQANANGMHIRVVNLSLASTVPQSYQQSALDAEVERLWHHGITVVAAAGNGTGAVDFAPGNDPMVITVGSIDDNYTSSLATSNMASWALWGTTQDGFAKPDVVADGSHVVSLLAPGSTLSAQHSGNIVGTSYFKMGGTSMAAPQVAGLAALMLQNDPGLTNGQIKRVLKRHSTPFGLTAYTSWLGTAGGFLDASAVGNVDVDDNAGVAWSASYNPTNDWILAGGAWWAGATWPGANWSQVALDQTSWTQTSWTTDPSTGLPQPSPTSAWTQTSWTQTSWTQTSWTQTSWTGIAWSQTSWTGTGWDSGTFS